MIVKPANYLIAMGTHMYISHKCFGVLYVFKCLLRLQHKL